MRDNVKSKVDFRLFRTSTEDLVVNYAALVEQERTYEVGAASSLGISPPLFI